MPWRSSVVSAAGSRRVTDDRGEGVGDERQHRRGVRNCVVECVPHHDTDEAPLVEEREHADRVESEEAPGSGDGICHVELLAPGRDRRGDRQRRELLAITVNGLRCRDGAHLDQYT